jgi:hypothetical protein
MDNPSFELRERSGGEQKRAVVRSSLKNLKLAQPVSKPAIGAMFCAIVSQPCDDRHF